MPPDILNNTFSLRRVDDNNRPIDDFEPLQTGAYTFDGNLGRIATFHGIEVGAVNDLGIRLSNPVDVELCDAVDIDGIRTYINTILLPALAVNEIVNIV